MIGPIIDTFGRKKPLVFSQVETAIAIAAIPFFKSVYPAFFICRCVLSLGSAMSLNMPLMPDYVDKKSVGLASAYGIVIMNLALIFASSGLYQIATYIKDQKYIYYGIASMIFLVAVYMVYGIKDVITEDTEDEVEYQTVGEIDKMLIKVEEAADATPDLIQRNTELTTQTRSSHQEDTAQQRERKSKWDEAKNVLAILWHELVTDAHFVVGILACAIGTSCVVGSNLFGTFLITDVYLASGRTKEEA